MGASIRSLEIAGSIRGLGPCMTTWTPRTCRTWGQRAPSDHMCWTWRGWPHICRCTKCGHTRLRSVV